MTRVFVASKASVRDESWAANDAGVVQKRFTMEALSGSGRWSTPIGTRGMMCDRRCGAFRVD